MTAGFCCELCGATVAQQAIETRVDGAILMPGQVRCATCNVEMRPVQQIEPLDGVPGPPPAPES